MNLKEFTKNVICSITDAVKECQDTMNNGSVINPAPTNDSSIRDVEFDVALSLSSDVGGGFGINVLPVQIDAKTSKLSSEVTRVRFSVPIIYSTKKSDKKSDTVPNASILDDGPDVIVT